MRLENAALTGAVDCKVHRGAKGKILKGNIQQPRRPEDHCYGSKRWFWPIPSVAGASRAPGSAGTGQSSSLISGDNGGYSSSDQTRAVTFVALN